MYLTKDPHGYVFLRLVIEPQVDILLCLGYVFDFNETVRARDEQGVYVVSGRRAQLLADDEVAVLQFVDGNRERVRLGTIEMSLTLRATLISKKTIQ